MRKSNTIIALAFALVAAACGGGGGSTAPANNGNGNNNNGNNGGNTQVPANTVIARSTDQFDPATLTVAIGTTVSFTFEATAHNVTFNAVAGRPADIPGNNSNTTITRAFNTAGTFPYQCTIHSGMTGSITVQ